MTLADVLMALVLLMQFGDAWTTAKALKGGAIEANPFVAGLIRRFGMAGLYGLKLSVGIALLATYVPGYMGPEAVYGLAILTVFYAWVLWNNWRVIKRK